MALSLQQTLFVNYYLGQEKPNGAEAARRAGYGWPDRASTRLLNHPQVKAAIEARVALVAMPADEVLGRISLLARADMSDFLTFSPSVSEKGGDDVPGLDLRKAKRLQRLGVVKKIKKTIREDGTTIEVELHDPLKALTTLAKILGMIDKNKPDIGTQPDADHQPRIIIPHADARPTA